MARFSLSMFASKAGIVLTSVLLSINMFLILTIYHTVPKVEVTAQLFTPDVMYFHQLMEATNLNTNISDKALIEEMIVRSYVENRHVFMPDLSEMQYRWGAFVQWLSAPAVYGAFSKEKGNYWDRIEERTDTASVHINSIYRHDNVFTVDFDVITFDGFRVMKKDGRQAVLTIRNIPGRKSFNQLLVNPYGTTVIQYKETEKKRR